MGKNKKVVDKKYLYVYNCQRAIGRKVVSKRCYLRGVI